MDPGPSIPKRRKTATPCPSKSFFQPDEKLEKYLCESSDEERRDELRAFGLDDDADSDSDYDPLDEDFASLSGDELDGVEEETTQSRPQIVWSEMMQTFPIESFQFDQTNRLLVDEPGNAPIYFFNLLVDDGFFALLVAETNAYAPEVLAQDGGAEFSRISRWKEVTVEEMRIFIGLLMHMGTIQLTRIQDYWKTGRLLKINIFGEQMSRDRFLLIFRCLHFARNPVEGESTPHDRLYKIRPLIDYFNNKMNTIYYPGKNLLLDEAMVLWRGRLLFRQHIQNKGHKSGIKFYMLTEPDGTMLKFLVYTGILDDMGGKGHAANVILNLMNEKFSSGHALFMNNHYNSVDLAAKLLAKRTYCTGTLRLDRKNNPTEVTTAKLKRGEKVCRFSNNGVLVGKWRDKGDVSFITTEFADDMVTYRDERNNVKSKPLAIFEYSKNMGGVDRHDLVTAYYPFLRKRVRWYKKLGIHVLQLLLLNAHILFNKNSQKNKMPLYDFRLQVIGALLPPKPDPPKPTKFHFPKKHPFSTATKRGIRKRCQNCHKQGLRKDTIYFCSGCEELPPLCIECFPDWHQ